MVEEHIKLVLLNPVWSISDNMTYVNTFIKSYHICMYTRIDNCYTDFSLLYRGSDVSKTMTLVIGNEHREIAQIGCNW